MFKVERIQDPVREQVHVVIQEQMCETFRFTVEKRMMDYGLSSSWVYHLGPGFTFCGAGFGT